MRKGDIIFNCHHCAAPLVVDAAAAGLILGCPRCGTATDIPLGVGRELPTRISSQDLPPFEGGHHSSRRRKLLVLGWASLRQSYGKLAATRWPRELFKNLLVSGRAEEDQSTHVAMTARPPTAAPKISGNVALELRTFRNLSASVYCPRGHRDSLPENIIFGLIALLAGAWPILTMFGAMAHR